MLNPRSIPACGELFDIEMIDDPIHRSALACAGNSHSCWIFNINQSVHPRLRGELISLFDADLDFVGSSPLTRGTPVVFSFSHPPARFIPAYAGNSALACSRRARRSVHPRLRGELILVLRPALIHIGSSPLTRGTQK